MSKSLWMEVLGFSIKAPEFPREKLSTEICRTVAKVEGSEGNLLNQSQGACFRLISVKDHWLRHSHIRCNASIGWLSKYIATDLQGNLKEQLSWNIWKLSAVFLDYTISHHFSFRIILYLLHRRVLKKIRPNFSQILLICVCRLAFLVWRFPCLSPPSFSRCCYR